MGEDISSSVYHQSISTLRQTTERHKDELLIESHPNLQFLDTPVYACKRKPFFFFGFKYMTIETCYNYRTILRYITVTLHAYNIIMSKFQMSFGNFNANYCHCQYTYNLL